MPSVNLEGSSDAVVEYRDGRIVKVCAVCRKELDRATGACPDAASHA
jgi:hypothetical protein